MKPLFPVLRTAYQGFTTSSEREQLGWSYLLCSEAKSIYQVFATRSGFKFSGCYVTMIISSSFKESKALQIYGLLGLLKKNSNFHWHHYLSSVRWWMPLCWFPAAFEWSHTPCAEASWSPRGRHWSWWTQRGWKISCQHGFIQESGTALIFALTNPLTVNLHYKSSPAMVQVR